MTCKLPLYAVSVLLSCGMLCGCKPTEKNYLMAYDKAQTKLRQGLSEQEYEMMLQESLPPYRRTASDSIRAFSEIVIWQYTPQRVDSGRKADPAPYNLAVGKYSMLTNAKAHADRLASDGWDSYVLRTSEPVYYVVAKMTASLDSVAAAAHSYMARYPNGTVALHEPMALIPALYR